MKKIFLKLTLVLLICALMMMTTVGCELIDQIKGELGFGDGAHTHEYTEEITKAPTCTEAGEKTFTCSCNDSYTEAIEKLPHTEEAIPAVAPTCTESGLTEGKKCSVCNEIFVAQKTVAPNGHAEKILDAVAPTCEDTGLTEGKQCSVCNEIIVAQQTVDALGHTEKILDAVAPTCEDTGLTEGKQCSVCDEIIVSQQTVDALGHTEETVAGKDATCTESGLTEGKKCSVCGKILVEQEEITAKGHLNITTTTIESTCKVAGSVTVTCDDCGVTVSTEELPLEAHAEEIVAGKDATCTETGLTEGKKCSVCDETLVAQEEIPAKGHLNITTTTIESTCKVAGSVTVTCDDCGVTVSTEELPLEAHAEEIVAGKDATCTETGLTEGKKCSVCDETLVAQKEIPAKAHTEEIVAGKDATCTETGLTEGKKCSVCGETLVAQEEIPALGHTEEILEAKDPTCTSTGLTEGKHCSVCKEVFVAQEELPALGHTEVIDAAVKPDCTNTGLTEGKHCSVCGETLVAQEELPALGHNYEATVTDPTCTDEGYTTYKCGNCGDTYTADIVSANGHAYPDEWNEDDNQHWRKCNNCDSIESGDHDVYNANCFCGYTNEHRVVNGNFENGLDGWILDNTFGDVPFAGIDEKTTFWGEGYPMFNVDKYFSSYADGASEASHGTLTSSYFIVNSEYATYMLGGAGNHNVYITIENKYGEVLALYRNTGFTDFPAGEFSLDDKKAMIGNTVFLANFITYKISLADFEGQEVRFVIHDYASEGWGVVFFDQLNTYYTAEDVIPENAILTENLLAKKDALKAELALEVTEQGDFTLDSYNAYLEKLAAAKALVNDIAVTQATVDEATAALREARLALAVRPVEEIADANKSFNLMSEKTLEITLADYINTNDLSSITYELKANGGLASFSEIADGKFIITAGKVSATTEETVTITVLYNGEAKLSVDLIINITADLTPVVMNDEVSQSVDAFEHDSITLDLSANIDNVGNLELTYSVNGTPIDGSSYVFTLGTYTDTVVYEKLAVTVSYTLDNETKSVSYTYSLGLYDSTVNRLENGGFENGLDGWTVVGNIGSVSSEKTYWNGEFGMDGEGMFSAYAPGATEAAVGTLTSSSFKVGGSGFITFKIGAMRDGNYVYVDVVDAETKEILARYYNGLWVENQTHCTLVSYKADLSAFAGREVFFRISDNADSGYGLFFADSFVTYYENEPEGFNEATPVGYVVSGTIYDLFNGGFEMGDVQGWWNNGEIGLVTNATGYWGDNIPYGKDGEYLFTGVESFGADTMREGNRGTLTSSLFEIGGTGMISFKLGGGGNELCYVQIIDVATNEVLARYHQQAQQDAVLIQYVADLSAHIGKTVRIQVVDYASSGWGCVSFDSVVTHYASANALPEGITANNIFQGVYNVTNGSFENGLEGWNMNVTWSGDGQNTLGWVESSEHDAGWYTKNDDRKDGNFLFTFCQPSGNNCENNTGTLESSTFTLKSNTYVSFRFGGAGTRNVNIQLVRADGTVIATFYNDIEGKKDTEMYAYYYQYTGETADCFFRVVDSQQAGDSYRCFVVDDFRANLEVAPEGFIPAIL